MHVTLVKATCSYHMKEKPEGAVSRHVRELFFTVRALYVLEIPRIQFNEMVKARHRPQLMFVLIQSPVALIYRSESGSLPYGRK